MSIYTIGHSTRSLEGLVEVLKFYNITELVDIRSMPRSRHTPQFNEDNLTDKLPSMGLGYRHLSRLGGLRPTSKDSINTAWRNRSFRGYADYMQTDEFQSGIEELLELTNKSTTAIMCAEILPWRCHRSMVGDALLVRDRNVIDIFDETKATPEKLTSFAQVEGHIITYPDTKTN